jgi:hypothetical protein
MPSRRAYLATLSAVALAGCIGDSPGSGTDSSPGSGTDSSMDTASRPDITIEAAAVQYAYRHIYQVDWNAIRPADGQFVFVTVDARDADLSPDREAFTLAADDEVYDPVEIQNRYPVDLDVPGEPYKPTEDAEPRGWLVFEVPATLDSAPSIRLERGGDSWGWDLDTAKATAPPPAWEWSVDVPETVTPDSTFDITVTAENVGDGPGTFRGAVNFSYPLYQPKGFDISLAAGESGEATVSASSKNAEPGKELEYRIRTPAGKSKVSVTVESEATATESTN